MDIFKRVFIFLIIGIWSYCQGNQCEGEECSRRKSGWEKISLYQKWHDDVQGANRIAKQKNCPILIAFLGPEWSDFSDRLEREILTDRSFLDSLENDLVFLKVDIPEECDQEEYRGKQLKELFCIDQCPTLVIAHPDGKEIARLDHLPIACSDLVHSIKGILEDYDTISRLDKKGIESLPIDQLQHLYIGSGRLADTRAKKSLLDRGLKIDRGTYFMVEKYGQMLRDAKSKERNIKRLRNKILARSPKNEAGNLRKLAIMDFEAIASVKKPKNAQAVIAPLVDYLKQFGAKDSENAWRIEMKIAQYLFSRSQIEAALAHARASKAMAPYSMQGEIGKSIDYLESFIQ